MGKAGRAGKQEIPSSLAITKAGQARKQENSQFLGHHQGWTSQKRGIPSSLAITKAGSSQNKRKSKYFGRQEAFSAVAVDIPLNFPRLQCVTVEFQVFCLEMGVFGWKCCIPHDDSEFFCLLKVVPCWKRPAECHSAGHSPQGLQQDGKEAAKQFLVDLAEQLFK